MVAVPEPLMVCGVNAAVALAGRPDAERATVPANPPCELTITLYAALPPAVIVLDAGEVPSAKSLGVAAEGKSLEDVATPLSARRLGTRAEGAARSAP